jgi:hypothetical protein
MVHFEFGQDRLTGRVRWTRSSWLACGIISGTQHAGEKTDRQQARNTSLQDDTHQRSRRDRVGTSSTLNCSARMFHTGFQ